MDCYNNYFGKKTLKGGEARLYDYRTYTSLGLSDEVILVTSVAV
ncbi:MAG: hypothetical protein PUB66_01840 [Oscillospiraceae bacterium]|nr:hypothetical protein [Oscillospiraceae bacterium]